MTSPGNLHHTFYENDIPPGIQRLLEELYESPFCVMEYFKIFKGSNNPKALSISSEESGTRHLLVYVISGREITVLNELIHIRQCYLRYFADTIFNRYEFIGTINFNCIRKMEMASNYPWRIWKKSHDIVIDLPKNFELYYSTLSKHTRKNLNYYLGRVRKKYADFDFQVTSTDDINPSVIGEIIRLNRLRMSSKNIRSGFTSLIEARITEFCRKYGSVGTITLQGKIVAGAICYEIGNQAYLEIISHDPDFNNDRVGQLCLLLTIKHMIAKGDTTFHLLWGENEYKYRFLGVKQELFHLSFYRSNCYKLMSAPKLAKMPVGSLRKCR